MGVVKRQTCQNNKVTESIIYHPIIETSTFRGQLQVDGESESVTYILTRRDVLGEIQLVKIIRSMMATYNDELAWYLDRYAIEMTTVRKSNTMPAR